MRTPSPSYCRLDLAPPWADRFIVGAAPIDYGPVFLLIPFGFHLTMDTLSSGILQGAAPGPPRLTSDDPSPHLSMPVALSRSSDLPGYCALTFPLMPVGSTSRRSVQELGFASTGPLPPPCRLY